MTWHLWFWRIAVLSCSGAQVCLPLPSPLWTFLFWIACNHSKYWGPIHFCEDTFYESSVYKCRSPYCIRYLLPLNKLTTELSSSTRVSVRNLYRAQLDATASRQWVSRAALHGEELRSHMKGCQREHVTASEVTHRIAGRIQILTRYVPQFSKRASLWGSL